MMKQKIGVVHPGMMGICVASTIQNSGHEVYWVAEGRSPQSRQRAEKFNLSDAGSLTAMFETCSRCRRLLKAVIWSSTWRH